MLTLFSSGKDDLDFPGEGPDASADRADRSDQLSSSSIIYPQVTSQVNQLINYNKIISYHILLQNFHTDRQDEGIY